MSEWHYVPKENRHIDNCRYVERLFRGAIITRYPEDEIHKHEFFEWFAGTLALRGNVQNTTTAITEVI